MTTRGSIGILLSITVGLSLALTACGGEPPAEPTSSGVTRSSDIAHDAGSNEGDDDESDAAWGTPSTPPVYGGGNGYCAPPCRVTGGPSAR